VTYLRKLATEMRKRKGEQYGNDLECMKISKGDSSKRQPNETLEFQPAKTHTIACIQWIIWRVNLIK
jgi:hypothetical protein